MKKFVLLVSVIVLLYIVGDYLYYREGVYIDISPNEVATTFVRTEGTRILMDRGNGYEEFEIKGVNMGSGIPGKWSTEFAIDQETYFRWFGMIQEMGANTIRIYTVQNEHFYNALYEYNHNNPDPLWILHGVWVNDYILNSHRDAYDPEFLDTLLEDCKNVVDVVHGKKKLAMGDMQSSGYGTYQNDISPWVIGYILGVEWEDLTVVFTDEKYGDSEAHNSYTGTYLYTSEDASPFEALLAQVGDAIIAHETERYNVQKLVAFSNWPTTDPFDYPETIECFFMKCANVDVEHIRCTEQFLSGQFASYHVYPYYPDYLNFFSDWSACGLDNPLEFVDENGDLNTYRAYLSMLTAHHTIPVVISEFGVSTGRGMAQRDYNTDRNQGHMAEHEQGEALVACYEDIVSTGCAGSCVFSWQDEWFKRTWNTMHAVNLMRTCYWSDYQTNEQYFGLLSFDPGEERCVSYVDGDISEWTAEDLVVQGERSSLSMKYDERFIYLLIYKEDLDFEEETLYLPIDVTPKSGSYYEQANGLLFTRPVDFLITINGKDNSRIQVQERYEALRSTFCENVYQYDTYRRENVPDPDSPVFVDIDMILQTATALLYNDVSAPAEVYETGLLRYGNANPEGENFDSQADFICSGDYIELKLPWQLLNFADPSRMTIHDDYFDGHYGIDYIDIDEMYLGLSSASAGRRIDLFPAELEGWGNKVTYHERLKPSYYILQSVWRDEH